MPDVTVLFDDLKTRAKWFGVISGAAGLGAAAGPLVVSAVSSIAPLAAAAVTMGLLTWAGSAWLIKWVPAYAARTRCVTSVARWAAPG